MADGALPYPAPPAPTDPRLPLNARQVFKLQKSWKGIKRNMAATGLEMFIRMFKSHNDTKQLFKDFRHIECEDELRMSETLEQHGTKVIEIIDDVITSIENVDYVFDLLKTTGKMHKGYTGFNPNLFWRIEEPFLKAVMIILGDRYTDNMDVIYKILIKLVLEGLSSALKEELANGNTNAS